MRKRIFSLLLAAVLALPLFCVSARAELPNGYWKYLSAYMAAVESGDEDAIIETGNAYLAFLSGFERNREIAENQYNVYNRCLELELYEKRGDWAEAVRNTEGLLDASEYLSGIGVDRADMERRCRIHLDVLRPSMGVYAVSHTQSGSLGSGIAASSGTYYGSVAEGRYGGGSICSFYVELESETAEQFGYLIEPKADGSRVILINLNFQNEGATVKTIPSGAYDAGLRETLRYLATLNSPVLLRIGGEMDLWSEPEEFKKAYSHIASLARSLAPKVELVWSPNFVSGWGVDAASYYPGDDKVDWVGVSLYFNYDANGSDDNPAWIEYTHAREFADPVASAERVLSIARSHNKPAIVTESGVKLTNGESYAAKKAAKEFSTLNMVYPFVKALVYFDKNQRGDYKLTGSAATAADAAIAENPTLIRPGEKTAAEYVPLEKLSESITGSVLLGATGRNYRCSDMSVVWRLDGAELASTAGSPNHLRLDLSSLSRGRYTLEAVFDDAQGSRESMTYTLDWDGKTLRGGLGSAQSAPAPAKPTGTVAGDYFYTDIVTKVNGTPIGSINVGGVTLICAEDLSHHGFRVSWNGEARTLSIRTGGSDFGGSTVKGAAGEVGERAGSYYYTDIVTYLDGRVITGYNTDGTTWIPAEDMRDFGYSVVWNGEARTLTVTG